MKRLTTGSLAILLSFFFIATADAKRHRHHSTSAVSQPCIQNQHGRCDENLNIGTFLGSPPPSPFERPARQGRKISYGGSETILPHPAGCPSTLFCGCGASVDVFGHSVRNLWPVGAWLKFPRTSPAPGMVAYQGPSRGARGHVFVLKSHVGGSDWIVNDYNSGNHRSRQHVRSIAGHIIVNPRGGGYAEKKKSKPETVAKAKPKFEVNMSATARVDDVGTRLDVPVSAMPLIVVAPTQKTASLTRPSIFDVYRKSMEVVAKPWVKGVASLPARLKTLLADATDKFGCPAVVNSAFRDPSYNRRVGGARRSAHLKNKAVDFRMACADSNRLYRWALAQRGITGIGYYGPKGHVHADVGHATRVTWTGGGRRYASNRHHRRHRRVASL